MRYRTLRIVSGRRSKLPGFGRPTKRACAKKSGKRPPPQSSSNAHRHLALTSSKLRTADGVQPSSPGVSVAGQNCASITGVQGWTITSQHGFDVNRVGTNHPAGKAAGIRSGRSGKIVVVQKSASAILDSCGGRAVSRRYRTRPAFQRPANSEAVEHCIVSGSSGEADRSPAAPAPLSATSQWSTCYKLQESSARRVNHALAPPRVCMSSRQCSSRMADCWLTCIVIWARQRSARASPAAVYSAAAWR